MQINDQFETKMDDIIIKSADAKILEYFPSLNRQDEKERQEKIVLLYSHGFILTPFSKNFINPFNQKSIGSDMLNLSHLELQNSLISHFPVSPNEIEEKIDILERANSKGHKIKMLFSGGSLDYGKILFLTSLACYFIFKDYALYILPITMLSTLLIYYWIAYQTSMDDKSRTAHLYIKRGGLIQFLTTISILSTLILIFFTYSSPFIYFIYLLYAVLFIYVNIFITRNLKAEWFQIIGIATIRDFYSKNDSLKEVESNKTQKKVKSEKIETINDRINLKQLMSSEVDFLFLIISKDEIIRNDVSTLNNILQQLIKDKQLAKHFREKIEISFDGYNDTTEELWEIPEVRDFVMKINFSFNYWLYFMTKNGNGLFAIIKCFLLPHLIKEADREINDLRLKNYLDFTAFPAMNYMCEITDISEDENIEMTDRFFEYMENR